MNIPYSDINKQSSFRVALISFKMLNSIGLKIFKIRLKKLGAIIATMFKFWICVLLS